MQEGSGVTNLQTELNDLNLFKTYCNFSDLAFLGSGGMAVEWGHLWWPSAVYMSSGVLRDKESSNRIELSQLVQDLLNFGVLGSLWHLGRGQMVGGIWGHGEVSPHMYTCMCMHGHAHMHMYRNCKWLPSWRHPCLSCLTCMCVHVHVCMRCPLHTDTHPYPNTPIPTPVYPPLPQSTHLPDPRNQ